MAGFRYNPSTKSYAHLSWKPVHGPIKNIKIYSIWRKLCLSRGTLAPRYRRRDTRTPKSRCAFNASPCTVFVWMNTCVQNCMLCSNRCGRDSPGVCSRWRGGRSFDQLCLVVFRMFVCGRLRGVATSPALALAGERRSRPIFLVIGPH